MTRKSNMAANTAFEKLQSRAQGQLAALVLGAELSTDDPLSDRQGRDVLLRLCFF